jgi:cytoskeletal protein CcmA (bactofilin family)
MAKSNEDFDSTAINLLGVGTTIIGDINSNGDIRINGTLTGNLTTKGRVIIGETGKINGEINCKNADILGLVEGKLFATESLSLKATASIVGEITIGRIAIEPGCKFNGTCKMTDNNSFNNDNKIDKKPDVK